MKLDQVIAAREQATKQALFERLPDSIETIRDAFREGREKWLQELEILVGESEAARVRNMMTTDI